MFLDEVGNLALETRQMLLCAIQERRYRPVSYTHLDVYKRQVQKERFRYFIKVPELAAFYNEITGDVAVENVHFSDSLLTLSYLITQREEREEET